MKRNKNKSVVSKASVDRNELIKLVKAMNLALSREKAASRRLEKVRASNANDNLTDNLKCEIKKYARQLDELCSATVGWKFDSVSGKYFHAFGDDGVEQFSIRVDVLRSYTAVVSAKNLEDAKKIVLRDIDKGAVKHADTLLGVIDASAM